MFEKQATKMPSRNSGWRILFLLAFLNFAAAERIKDMMYQSIDGDAACFRRHNGTHQFGCSSSRAGSVGVIHIVENELDLQWLEKNATAGPYSILMPFYMFTINTLHRLRNTSNVNGVLLAKTPKMVPPMSYSPDDTCPNRYSGYKSCMQSWNPHGNSMLLEDWPFPMFYIQNETQINDIRKCYEKYNAYNRSSQIQRSLCALEMNAFMFAAIDSESCMRRSQTSFTFNPTTFCDPLGSRNIHWPLQPLKDEQESVIMVVARLDANGLFVDTVPGAGSAVTGLVTLLATAMYLQSLNATVTKKNIVFSLLNGEALDYIGSSRLVYDLKEGTFNSLGGKTLTLKQINSVIELGQLGEGDIYLHGSNFKDNLMLTNLQEALNATVMENSLPPASIQSFLREQPNLSAIVIANHGEKFVNNYYNSLLDDGESLGYFKDNRTRLVKSLARVAIGLGNELYKNITGNSPTGRNITHIEEYVDEMLTCYLVNANCSLFRAASSPGSKLKNQSLSMYISVIRSPHVATILTGHLLALLTGEHLPHMNASACEENHLAWLGGYNFTGMCVNSSVNYSEAISPAFIIEGYDMKSGRYSTWTESVWQTMGIRMFLKPSDAVERFSMILGSLVMGASYIIVLFIKSKVNILFGPSDSVDL